MSHLSRIPTYLIAIAFPLLSAAVGGCASMTSLSDQSTKSSLALEFETGVALGSLTEDGRKYDLRNAYVDTHSTESSNQGDETEIISGVVRVILATRELPATTIAEIAHGTWKGDNSVKGVIVDLDHDDDSWTAQFLSPTGFQTPSGVIAKYGEAYDFEGRASGRIGMSSKTSAGTREFNASFDISTARNREHTLTSASASLIGEWTIELSKEDDDNIYKGALKIDHTEGGLLQGVATLRVDNDRVVTELFDIRVSGNSVRLDGVVEPSSSWMADSLSLTMRGDALIGDLEDESGDVGTARLRRAR
jgi:hypothetical protein